MSTAEDIDIRPRRTKTEDADLDITPMIDITFLLLAFFVVVSKMDAQVPVAMPKAKSGSTVAEENCVIIVVATETPGGPAKIYKGQALDSASQVTSEGALDIESEIAEYIENEISNRPTVEAILIKGAGEARTGDIETIKRGAARSELAQSRKLYFGVEEE
ncbi:MAG: biopolymer transporter ExbD [Planctomycetota bacterium]